MDNLLATSRAALMPAPIPYSVAPEIFDAVPGYRRIVLLAHGVANAPSDAGLESELRAAVGRLEEQKVTVTTDKIASWWSAYRAVGIRGDKSKVQPGVAALLRRIAKGKGAEIPFISVLVALTNCVALEHLCPTGAFDFTKVKGPIVLGPAKGTETFTPIANPKTGRCYDAMRRDAIRAGRA